MKNGYIKLFRDILDWEWYKDANTCRVFLHMILKANWKPGKFKGVEVPRGSLVISANRLAEELNLTLSNVRTAIKHLKLTGELTCSQHAKFTVFTIKNYDFYQGVDTIDDTQLTTIEEYKNNNKKNNKDIVLQAAPSDEAFEEDPYKDVSWESSYDHHGMITVMVNPYPESEAEQDVQLPADDFVDTAKIEADQNTEPHFTSNGSSDYLYEEAVGYLNKKTGKHFKSTTKAIRRFLRYRFEDGFGLEDIKRVIDIKAAEWLGSSMSKYLRPSTLFGDNFEAYLNQEPVCGRADPQHPASKSVGFGTKKGMTGTKFNNFTQRQYDFDLLEQQLLAAGSQLIACSGAAVPAAAFC